MQSVILGQFSDGIFGLKMKADVNDWGDTEKVLKIL